VPDLRELLDKATPLPWYEDNEHLLGGYWESLGGKTGYDLCSEMDADDAAFAAAAVNAAPAFLALLDAAEEWKLNWPSPKHTEKLMDAIAAARSATGGAA